MLVKPYRIVGFYLLFSCVILPVFGQDSLAVRAAINQLTAPGMHGRGYVQGGLDTAANFLVEKLTAMGLQVQKQPFEFPVNTFPGRAALSINGRKLEPGKDFLLGPESMAFDGTTTLLEVDSTTWASEDRKVMVELRSKLTWSVATRQQNYTRFEVLTDAMPLPAKKLKATVDASFVPSFIAHNIFATIPGTRKPDSTIVFTAHYDHLGMMGASTIFPGANDNASGTAMLLALAKQIAAQPLDYTVVFIFFAGEEAGLVGSSFYVSHPLLPLSNIRFLLNLDLMGNGEEGITVVNASVFEKEFNLLQEINNTGKYLVAINSRGKAQNSDHYYFTEKGVPSFFWYTLGKRKAYHDVDDIAATVPLYEANDLLQLALHFSKQVIFQTRK